MFPCRAVFCMLACDKTVAECRDKFDVDVGFQVNTKLARACLVCLDIVRTNPVFQQFFQKALKSVCK